MTKKLGIINLPPPFWMSDPKINPKSEHLLWAALLLGDPNRYELAKTVLSIETFKNNKTTNKTQQEELELVIRLLVKKMVNIVEDKNKRDSVIQLVNKAVSTNTITGELNL